MPNQQLVEYIRSQLKLGVMKPDLVKAIQAAGWTKADMDAAFIAAEGQAPTPPAPPQTPAATSQPAPVTINQSGRPAAIQPTSMQGGSLQPLRPRPALSSNDPGPGMRLHTVRGRFSSWMLYVLISVVVVVGFVIYLLPILRPLIFGGLTLAPAAPPAQDISPDQSQTQEAQPPSDAGASASTSTSTSTPISTSTPQFVGPAASTTQQ